MSDDRRNRLDPLEENVERLLGRSRPELSMPQATKDRILSVLTGEDTPASEKPAWRRRAPWWATAAAAVVVMGLIAFWPGTTTPALAWSDVAEHFEGVRSMVAWVTSEETSLAGAVKVTRMRALQKDPGLSRTEIVSGPGAFPPPGGAVPPERLESAMIMRSDREKSTIVRLSYRERTVHRTTLSYAGTALEGRETMPRGLVATTWRSLRGLASDDTRIIGRREIDGTPTVGFEAGIDELPGGRTARVRGVARVWASAETAVPIEIELEFVDDAGGRYRTRLGNLEWDAPLADDLFELPDLEGWTIVDEWVREVGFPETALADGVTLRVGPEDGPVILSEIDVAAVPSGREVGRTGEEPRRTVTLVATPDAESRLRQFTSTHLGERVVFDLDDGGLRFEIRIGGTIGREMQVDITPTGMTLEEFAGEYLASPR
jgi:outer membrane lipoprotein-sorting protein